MNTRPPSLHYSLGGIFMNLRPERTVFAAVVSTLAIVLVVSPLFAAAPTIEDNGGFFSKPALTQGNRIVEQINEQTRPHKDVVVETFPTIPSDVASTDELAKRIFREREVDGVVIVAVKQPGSLSVGVGRQTQS